MKLLEIEGASDLDREATATIRGYIYQFDSTIRALLALEDNGHLIIEGIEDFDSYSNGAIEYCQCKYYAAQKHTSAVLRDAILPMLKRFINSDFDVRKNTTYCLYGYYKESMPGVIALSLEMMKDILVRYENVEDADKKKHRKIVNLQQELCISDEDIVQFISKLRIEIGLSYEENKLQVIEDLRKITGGNTVESEAYTYPTALAIVSDMASKQSVENRILRKADFVRKIRPSMALYNLWCVREHGEVAYCRKMKARYFSFTNIDPIDRFFVIDVTSDMSDNEIYSLICAITGKWSSHQARRKPDTDRYAPYIFLKGISSDRLMRLKGVLFEHNLSFVDGYPFQGSKFSISHIKTPQTSRNGICARFIGNEEEFSLILGSASRTRSVFHFYISEPLGVEFSCRLVQIPVKSLQMIESIV